MPRKRIGIMTGGGDCPGLNAVIRAAVKTLITRYQWEAIGFLDGFSGLVHNNFRPLTYDRVSGILTEGGTILGTDNKSNYFGIKRNESQRNPAGRDYTAQALRHFKKHRLDGLICIGGDGTLTVANYLHEKGIPIVGVPKTIDNDVRHTDQTFGFDTATSVATEAVDRLHSSAMSHKRVMIIEVMGRSAGWIALTAGLGGGGDIILIPEIPFEKKAIFSFIKKRFKMGRHFCIIVAAEGAHEGGELPIYKTKAHQLGGISQRVATDIEKSVGIESRAVILGHLQRGGTPTPYDRVLASRYGHKAALLAAQGLYGLMVCLSNNQIESIPLKDVAGVPRRIPLDSPLIQTARDVGTSFGTS